MLIGRICSPLYRDRNSKCLVERKSLVCVFLEASGKYMEASVYSTHVSDTSNILCSLTTGSMRIREDMLPLTDISWFLPKESVCPISCSQKIMPKIIGSEH